MFSALRTSFSACLAVSLSLSDASVVFDPKTERHHHFIDEETGEIHDIPWDKVQVCNVETLRGFEIHDYQVVIRGVRSGRKTASRKRT